MLAPPAGVQQLMTYSMTWSARPSSDGGTVRPRALAVFRLMTSSNFVGRSIGRSPGLAPFRMRSTKLAECLYMSRISTP